MNDLWDKSWGDPEEYAVDPDLREHHGIMIGDNVVTIQEIESYGIGEGEEGQVVGIARLAPGMFHPDGKIELLVSIGGADPIGTDTMFVEAI